jgi:hypothetical protein
MNFRKTEDYIIRISDKYRASDKKGSIYVKGTDDNVKEFEYNIGLLDGIYAVYLLDRRDCDVAVPV